VLDRTKTVTGLIAAPIALPSPKIGRPKAKDYADWKAACRKREQREREALEQEQVTTTPVYAALCEALIAAELLSEAEALDPAKVEAAATAVLDEWARAWTDQ
jgi:hypothetical protein